MKVTNDLRFVGRKNVGADFINAEPSTNRFCGAFIITCRHNDPKTELMQRFQRIWRGFLDRISDTHKAGDQSIHDDKHNRLALVPASIGRFGQALAFQPHICHQARIAQRDFAAINNAFHALASDRVEVFSFR